MLSQFLANYKWANLTHQLSPSTRNSHFSCQKYLPLFVAFILISINACYFLKMFHCLKNLSVCSLCWFNEEPPLPGPLWLPGLPSQDQCSALPVLEPVPCCPVFLLLGLHPGFNVTHPSVACKTMFRALPNWGHVCFTLTFDGWMVGWFSNSDLKNIFLEKLLRPLLLGFCFYCWDVWCYYDFLSFSPRASLIAQRVKNPPLMQETLVQFLGWEVPLEKG